MLSDNLLTIDPDGIADLKVTKTFVDGRKARDTAAT